MQRQRDYREASRHCTALAGLLYFTDLFLWHAVPWMPLGATLLLGAAFGFNDRGFKLKASGSVRSFFGGVFDLMSIAFSAPILLLGAIAHCYKMSYFSAFYVEYVDTALLGVMSLMEVVMVVFLFYGVACGHDIDHKHG